jgi:hypothetical protein
MSDLYGQIHDLLLSHFLCEYSPTSPKKHLQDIVRVTAARQYSVETVENFLAARLDTFRTALVAEFNHRISEGLPLRFEVVDTLGEGHQLRGYRINRSDGRLAFQNVLHDLDPARFEHLSAVVLKRFRCEQVFLTPQSHDQGVDSFGYRTVFPSLSKAVSHKLVWIAQAKHYVTHAVSTSVVRELVGSNELLISKIFSTVDERYKQLSLTPYGPAALVLITTHEIPSTVRRLAERAGVYVLESSDLFELFKTDLTAPFTLKKLEALLEKEVLGVPVLQ